MIDGLAVAPDEATVFEDRNMNASREMPKYECHKKVWALKIAGIVGDQHGGEVGIMLERDLRAAFAKGEV